MKEEQKQQYEEKAIPIREAINSRPLTDFYSLERSKGKGYVCPICGSGTGKHRSGALFIREGTNIVTCFSNNCFRGEDTLGALRKLYPDRKEKDIFELCGYSLDADIKPMQRKSFQKKQNPQKKEEDYTPLYREWAKHIEETDYWRKRGLSLATCQKFCIGYAAEWKSPMIEAEKAQYVPSSPRLIIPVGLGGYLARDTRDPNEIPEKSKNYVKQKTGTMEIFNLGALKSFDPVFVVEGEIDALSLEEIGLHAVGLGSKGMVNAFLKVVEKERPKCSCLLIALDNDSGGREATGILKEGLESLNIPCHTVSITGEYKDPNEFLCANRQSFADNAIEVFYQYAEPSNCALDAVSELLSNMGKLSPCYSTGFANIDGILNGGLRAGLIVIGAESSLGKTTLSLQIADNIAREGQDVLIYSIEMARNELIAKSLARLTDGKVQAYEILAGEKKLTQEQKTAVSDAAGQYMEFAGNLFIEEGSGCSSLDVRRAVVKHIERNGNHPVVVVDYLQILDAQDDHMTDIRAIDANVRELRQIARDYSIPVIVISSFNRQSYGTDATNMAAAKGSGSIEYSSDVLLSLGYGFVEELEGKKENAFRQEYKEKLKSFWEDSKQGKPCKMILTCQKNRMGRRGGKAYLSYTHKKDKFEIYVSRWDDFGGSPVSKKVEDFINS